MKFIKYHGLGNDFVFIEDFEGELVVRGEELAQKLCHRHFGIGADGLVLITKMMGLYAMRIFNADGTEAEMCGNALRCVADYLLAADLVEGPSMEINTRSGVKKVTFRNGQYTVDMGEPDFSFNQGKPIGVVSHGQSWQIYPVSMGNPHGVVFLDDLSKLDFEFWGPRLEQASVWPQGANIEFTQVLNSQHLLVRVWERGAGPTLACGTGACAAAVTAGRIGLTKGRVRVTLPGGDLFIEHTPENRVLMTGPAEKVFEGTIDLT
ncbi:MAG: diaminopimelate epimerase [Limnochordia bacterium]